MTLDDASAVVSQWAEGKPQISRIWFFGSRVRAEERTDSDLDVAIELKFGGADTCFAHWAFEQPTWHSELRPKLPWHLDLQLFHPQGTPTVASALERSSMIVFERRKVDRVRS